MVDTKDHLLNVAISTINDCISESPSLAGWLLNYLSSRVSQELTSAIVAKSQAELGMATALVLLPPNRVNDDARKHLAAIVSRAFPKNDYPNVDVPNDDRL